MPQRVFLHDGWCARSARWEAVMVKADFVGRRGRSVELTVWTPIRSCKDAGGCDCVVRRRPRAVADHLCFRIWACLPEQVFHW